MNHLSSIFGSSIAGSYLVGGIIIGSGLLVFGTVIAELTDTNMTLNTDKWAVVTAKKLDINDDGLISLAELTSRQTQRFQKLDRDANGQIDKIEFNAPLATMFNRMDENCDSMLDDDEISKLTHGGDGKRYNGGGGG